MDYLPISYPPPFFKRRFSIDKLSPWFSSNMGLPNHFGSQVDWQSALVAAPGLFFSPCLCLFYRIKPSPIRANYSSPIEGVAYEIPVVQHAWKWQYISYIGIYRYVRMYYYIHYVYIIYIYVYLSIYIYTRQTERERERKNILAYWHIFKYLMHTVHTYLYIIYIYISVWVIKLYPLAGWNTRQRPGLRSIRCGPKHHGLEGWASGRWKTTGNGPGKRYI